ncbi:MAG TPA: hypothetical protein DIW31_09120 [Bacteroidales bacterium]|nr:hypothetical protein [Bacteroidales bacterium]
MSALMLALQHAFAQKQLSESAQKEVSESFTKAKELEETGDFNQAGYYYNSIATTYWTSGIPKEAIPNFQKVIEMYEKVGNRNAIKNSYNNIGMAYTDLGDYSNALVNFEKCLVECRTAHKRYEIASTLINIANTYSQIAGYNKAISSLDEALTIAKELNEIKLLRNIYSILASNYEKLGNTQKSAEYFNLYTTITRNIQKQEIERKEAEAKIKVEEAQSRAQVAETQKQQTQIALNENKEILDKTEKNLQKTEKLTSAQKDQIEQLNREKEFQQIALQNERLIRNIFIVIIIAILAFSTLLFISLWNKKKANKLLAKQNIEITEQRDMIEQQSMELVKAVVKIEKQNTDITSSISYAQQIQEALLPTEDNFKNFISDSFVYFKPREAVSGDFYWFTAYSGKHDENDKTHRHNIKLSNISENERGLIITAVDCTGHGVPGAFMSMIGFNLLETITRSGIVKPNEMLNELHKSIRYLLKQNKSDNRDGMDMAICVVKDRGKRIEYAGAKNPLICISNGKVHHIKGDPVPVGGIQKEVKREFTLHNIDITSPSYIYIFTDGYTDQFGGEEDLKFSTQQLKNLLLEIHLLPMAKQKEILDQKIVSWMGERNKQLDDILVIGFKLDDKKTELS